MSGCQKLAILRKHYGDPIGVGRNRTVFRNGAVVYKFAHNSAGVDDNYQEAAGPAFDDMPQHFANCRLTSVHGVEVLEMEYVKHCGWPSEPCPEELEWTWSIDCGQVGYTSDGRLVAYDWGPN